MQATIGKTEGKSPAVAVANKVQGKGSSESQRQKGGCRHDVTCHDCVSSSRMVTRAFASRTQ